MEDHQQQLETSSASQPPIQEQPQQQQPEYVCQKKDQEQNTSNPQEQQSLMSTFLLPQTTSIDPQPLTSAQQESEASDALSEGQTQQSEAEKVENVSEQLTQLKIQESSAESLKIAPRKKLGTLGQPILVQTNTLPIKFGNEFPSEIIHYDVNIVPDKPNYLMRDVFIKAKKILFPNINPAFDGKKIAYSRFALFEGREASTEVTVYNEDNREKKFKFTMKEVKRLDLSWVKKENPQIEWDHQKTLQALDVILRNASTINSKAIIGRSFFTSPATLDGKIISLGGGMELWVGLFQSACLGWKPFLNIDVAHKGFPSAQSVIDLMKSMCGVVEGGIGADGDRGQSYSRGGRGGYYNRGGRGGFRAGRGGGQQYGRGPPPTELTPDLIRQYSDDIVNHLKGLKVKYEIPGQATSRRTYRVNDLVRSAREDGFLHNENMISLENYYQLEKKYIIRYPHYPCLSVGPKDKNIHVPVELCTIVAGQATLKKLNDRQTTAMIREAGTDTDARKKKILETFRAMKHEENPCMKEFGITLGNDFDTVPARVLPAPQLMYRNENTLRVSKGEWQSNQFLNPSELISNDNSWSILNLVNRIDDGILYKLKDMLKKTGSKSGMTIGDPETPFKTLRDNDFPGLVNYFKDKKQAKLELIIVIVPDKKGPYGKVKQSSELQAGIVTQCIKSKTLQGRAFNEITIRNILLKINAKLNGTNHELAVGNNDFNRPKCLEEPCMIVGADVTHPSPGAKDIPSIAAVAASHDPNAFMYNIEIRLQQARQEIIQDLKEIMIIQLKRFKEKSGYEPSKIIFYRDGVSEGQFEHVIDVELNAIRQACTMLNSNYKPPITFLVVQKRHNIRLFPQDRSGSDDYHKNKNVKAGTVVDTQITSPLYTNFYLVSHASIQGTARPTKYCCLWDDSDLSENEIEKLTYFLCHMFSRCNRSVSYPAPTYYAHLAAYRARVLTENIPINMDNLEEEQRRKMTIHSEVLKDKPMFFV